MDEILKNQPQPLVKKVFHIFEKIILFISLIAALIFISYLFKPLADLYLTNPYPAGGDYFNAVTYATHFSEHLPFPPSGWLNFWYQGAPIIGGYPVLPFYLMSPLFKTMTAEVAMESFAIFTQLLFLLFSLLLFWEVSSSVIFALILTLIALVTRATYYQLFAEGLVVAGSSQWFLPATLFFIFRFLRTKNNRYFILGAILAGLSLVSHNAMGALTVLLPSIIFLFGGLFFSDKPIRKKFLKALLFIIMIFSIGSIGIYSLLLAMFGGAGSQPCSNPQCWGIYPFHLQSWLTPYVWVASGIPLIIAIIIKFASRLFSKSQASFKPVSLSLIALLIFSLYPLLAYLHLINTPAATIFPRRTFWALNLLLLLVAASCYRFIAQLIGKKISFAISVIILLIFVNFLTSRPVFKELDVASFIHSNVEPENIEQYFLPKYKSQDLSKVVPEQVISYAKNENNYRFDSFNHKVTHWWNSYFITPSTRGYSNYPFGEFANWFYYLQTGTGENKKEDNPEIVKNRTLFLLDHFAIGLYEDTDSNVGYDRNLLADRQIFPSVEGREGFMFYDISKTITSPIVSATNAIPLLIVTDDNGYETIFRTLSLTGLTSRKLIPVKGPVSINNLNSSLFEHFPILFLYRFKGNNWKKIEEYIQSGGKVIIDLGSLEEKLDSPLPAIFPIESIEKKEVSNWQLAWVDQKSPPFKLDQFSPPVYENNPWKVYEGASDQVRSFGKVMLTNNNNPIIISGNIGKGSLILSGLNLPYHIIQFANLEEVKLFKQLLGNFEEKDVKAEVVRDIPEKINVSGKNFSGIYFKENYHSGWKAKVSGKNIPVLKAGPAFMYIPIPKQYQDNPQVILEFKGNAVTWGLFILTLSTLVLSLFSLVTNIHLRLGLNILKNLTSKLFKGWREEE